MTKWVKPSGVEVEVNDHPANVAKARELKWKPVSEVKVKEESKKKKAPAETNSDESK